MKEISSCILFIVRLAAHVSNGCKSLIRPGGGKDTAKTKNKIRELTDRNRGISNTEREKKYQEYV